MLEVVDNKAFQTLRGIIGELYKAANAAVDAERRKHTPDQNDASEDMSSAFNAAHVVGQLDFLPLDSDMDTLGGTFNSLDAPGDFGSTNFDELNAPNTLEGIENMNFSEFMST